MIKRIALSILVAISINSCKNDSSQNVAGSKTTDVTVHEMDELRLTLPATYQYINSVQDLKQFFENHGGEIAETDTGLFDWMVNETGMNRRFYFDAKSDDQFNFVYVDLVGPRFPLQDQLVNNYVGMYEKQLTIRYASRQYKLEKLDLKRMTVLQNEIVNVKHKHTLDDLVWYTDHYYIQMKGNRRSLILVSYDYNGGGLDLKDYLTTVY
jgi:hypothetical protein